MEVLHKHSLHSDLPEKVLEPDHSVYKFYIPDYQQPHTAAYNPPTVDATCTESEKPTTRQGKWSRWPLLLLCGVLLMIIAGVAGGFIGKTIEHRKYEGANSLESETCPKSTSAATPSSSILSSTLSATPTPSSTVFERTIPQPSSGCNSTDPYHSFKSRSYFLEVPYTTICGQGWLNDELTAMSVATQSDCIEACVMYNAYKQSSDRSCVGGGFIPEWWNQTRAMLESGKMPYNCFLKTNTTGIARNNKEYEVIALCMAGQCDDISS
jgi:hypothetical protein